MSDMVPIWVLIPSRLASTRLPDKALADLAGLPMVVRVARQAQASVATQVVVATDHARIAQACAAHGVQAVMTDEAHPSGSDRLAQASDLLAIPDDAIVVNVQGDEPLIEPEVILQTARQLAASGADIATVAHPIVDAADFFNPNVVKVVCRADGDAAYFSRAPIPYARDHFAQDDLTPCRACLREVLCQHSEASRAQSHVLQPATRHCSAWDHVVEKDD